ncbi:MAG: terminase TerL endonuclease subunit [Anaerolineales bacterium]|jgi:phage terminase large subunit-like protein
MMHPCTQYAIDVVEGRRVVGKSEYLACKRHLDDLERQGSDVFPWVFDEARAERVYQFIGYCHHVEGELAGQPIVLEMFQKFDIGVMFGWIHKDSGERRFKKAYIQVARKNGKTAILAAVALYLMVGDDEMSPRVYCAAVDRGQARLMYDAAKSMADNSPDIAKRLIVRDYKISHAKRGGVLAPLSKETKNKDGLHPSGALVDEYHAHVTSEIYDLLSSAKGGHRKQPLMVIITTAGMDVESPCHHEYDYCKLILEDPSINERYFVMIRELDPEDDEHDPAVWVKSNPLRVLIPRSLEELHEQHDEAFGSKDPAKIRTFRVKNLNIWQHGNEDTYMGDYIEQWDALGVPTDKFAEITKGKLCLVGVDLSKKVDLTADGFVFALDAERVAVCAHGFIPKEAIKRHEKTDKIPYTEWARGKWITATEGDITDYNRIQEHIAACKKEYGWEVHQLCYDPYNATHFATQLAEAGYTTVEIRQTMQNLNEPTKLFRDLVASGKLVHDGSPLLKWCVGNARQIVDTKENIMLSKRRAGDTRRIDLLAAIIDALRQLDELRKTDMTGFGF